jgi:uncharacterized protein YecT (DUF1311 family)
VGFHAAYTNKDGQPAISSAANAVIGAYLNQLGLSAAAIVYITSSPPEGMQWLNLADARRFGIDVQPVDLSSKVNTEPSAPRTPLRSPQQSAGDTASTFYHSRYLLAGFLIRATNVCEELDVKRTVEAGLKVISTPELKALERSYPKTTGQWLVEGGESFNQGVMTNGVAAACAYAITVRREAEDIAKREGVGQGGASFNCNIAQQPDEVLICQSDELSGMDREMSRIYFQLRNDLSGSARDQLEKGQARWLRSRMQCGGDFGCIQSAYQDRINTLNRFGYQ